MVHKRKAARLDFNEVEDATNYFVVDITRTEVFFKEIVAVAGKPPAETLHGALPRHIWKRVESSVIAVLRKGYDLSIKNATFKYGTNAMSRMAGRELMVLVWALISMSQRAIATEESPVVTQIAENWVNLDTNTRWWLYTLGSTRVSGADEELGFGWKSALFHGLAANYT